MRLRDSVSCDELRFPVEMWLDPDAIIELPAVWPDSPPLPLIVYQVIIYTGADSSNDTNFTVFLNIYGSKGDIGRRSLRNAAGTQPDSIFKPSNADTFELEAVSVQNIESIEIGLLEPKETSHWFVDRVQILDSDGGRLYMFDVKSWFSASKGNGSTQRRLSTTRVTEAQEE
uniref:PLAT domain-containing protein n=1 Tax=Plectus sambesii TaxID=2011161 RepID=A0A914WSS5_9BILA